MMRSVCASQEQQTALHISARLGNVDNVALLLQHGAQPNATSKDMCTALHIAAKEGHEDVAVVLLDHGANQTLLTKAAVSFNTLTFQFALIIHIIIHRFRIVMQS